MTNRNPFPGPQPYQAADRARFFARDNLITKLSNQMMARASATVFGPSGAGKSSLMQAGVIPALEETDGLRVVRLDTWPESVDEPLVWVVDGIFEGLGLGTREADTDAMEALRQAIDVAERGSDRPICIYLDQFEQLFIHERREEAMRALLDGLNELIQPEHPSVHVVISLREDYVGRLRDWTRECPELSAHGFRVAPLTVGEMKLAMLRTAAEGEPAQAWDEREIETLMMEVRVPGQRADLGAEVQAAFGQIVCRALWEERLEGKGSQGKIEAEPRTSWPNAVRLVDGDFEEVTGNKQTAEANAEFRGGAEAILRRYLDATVEGLGGLGKSARKLLEERLIDDKGNRKLLTEKEAMGALPGEEARRVLEALERAAVLRAKEHQGGRYFELGHDWLAKKVFEQRKAEERRRERRRLLGIAVAAVMVAVVVGGLGVVAWWQREEARRARLEAREKAEEATRATRMAGVRELMAHGNAAHAALVLLEVKEPPKANGWLQLAIDVLTQGTTMSTLINSEEVKSVAWSPDSRHVVTASSNGLVRIWTDDGEGDPRILQGHQESVNSIAWSPDGKRIITASNDNTARIWSIEDQDAPIILKGHDGNVNHAAWSPDGSRVVTVSWDNTGRIWNASGEGESIVLRGHEEEVLSVEWSPGGSHIVTVSKDGTARIWQAEGASRRVLRVDGNLVNHITSAKWSPDGKHIITTVRFGAARLWDVEGEGKPTILGTDEKWADLAAWRPDGRYILTTSGSRAILWKFGAQTKVVELDGHRGTIHSAEWSADGQFFATASDDASVHIWDRLGGERVVLTGHSGGVDSLHWSPDGKRIVTISQDRSARIWRVDGKGVPFTSRGHGSWIHVLSWSPDSSHLATGSWDNTVRIWDINTVNDPLVLEGHKSEPRSIAWSPDSKRIAVLFKDKVVWLWNADGTGEPLILKGHTDVVNSVAWNPRGTRIVTTSSDQTARIWDPNGNSAVAVLKNPPIFKGMESSRAVRSAEWSPDGTGIVTVSSDGVARIWSENGSGEPLELAYPSTTVTSAVWSPDGKYIATTSNDGVARIWNTDERGEPIAMLRHTGELASVRWSPEGKRIVTASGDETARIWAVDDPDSFIVLMGHAIGIRSAEWNSSGDYVVTTSADGIVRICNSDTGGLFLTLKNSIRDKIISAVWSPDGQYISTGSWGSARVWPISMAALQQALRDATTDCLSPTQRQLYLLESESEARPAYESCERSHNRTPYINLPIP